MIYSIILSISACFSLYYGSVQISFLEIRNLSFLDNNIFTKIMALRVSGFFQAAMVGAILALCGYVLQKILKNPLADPFILGISSGGICFASVFILLNSSALFSSMHLFYFFPLQSAFALIGCLTSFFILLFVRKKIKSSHDEYVFPVIGIIINSFFTSILMMVFSIAKPEQLSEIHNFLIGTLQPVSFYQILVFFILSVFPLIIIFRNSKYFDHMLFSDDFGKSMGINPIKIRNKTIFMICILISLVVSSAGIIAFVGLIIPHIVRKIHRFSSLFECVICMFLGAIILVNADTLSRTLFSPAQLSVGIFTAILGAPALSFILFKRNLV
ncbi:FecCD family ABC transporter permease [Silvanigrella aquatica]|nr:iron ABC transporter permease [Silvanigrella aquatica]